MFNTITKTFPTYTLFIGENIDNSKIKLINCNKFVNNIGINLINKYKYYYYYLYKKFNKDLALKLMINYIIKLHIKIPINYYYKLHTNYCYELFTNKIILVKSQYNNKYKHNKQYNINYKNEYTLAKILRIYKKMINISNENIIKEMTYLELDNLGINIILDNTKSNIIKINIGGGKKLIKVQFNNSTILDNYQDLINILYKYICLCDDCINKRQEKTHKIKSNYEKRKNNNYIYWIDPLKHIY